MSAIVNYFPISKELPSDIVAIDNAWNNINKGIYELSISLFSECNLHCSFCFQNNIRISNVSFFDSKYILSIPNAVQKYVSQKLDQYNSKILYVRIWGGEIFQDKFNDYHFSIYKKLCDDLIETFKNSNPSVAVKFNFMTNGIWLHNTDRIIQLAKEKNAYIGFSYDPVGRYSTLEQKKLAIFNIKKTYKALKYVNVATTLTKPTIQCIVENKDMFFNQYLPNVAIEVNSYIPNNDWQINLPTAQNIFDFYKYCLDNKKFMLNSLNLYVKAVLGIKTQLRETFCDCKASVQYSDGKLISDCIAKSTCLNIQRFYGKFEKAINNDNCHDIKTTLAIFKRKCLNCKYYNICPGFCAASILFDEYSEDCCPIYMLYGYISDNKQTIQENFNEYCKNYLLPEQMQILS